MLYKAPNHLLQRDDVGKSKASTRTLPNLGFSYGYPVPTDGEGVGKCKIILIKINNFRLVTTIWTKHK
jgi:hypothetical protein